MTTAGTAPSERVKIIELDAQGNPVSGSEIEAQFNPTSLQYTINNTAAQGSSRQRSRRIDESTGKLTMELVFDTTHNGDDVRKSTQRIAVLMKPAGQGQQTPIVRVTWGNIFKFEGALDSYRETIDFFSEGGVPLRASLSLGFTTVATGNQTPRGVFAFASQHVATADTATFQGETIELPAVPGGPAAAANDLGDPDRAREIAEDNDVEDIRNGSDAGDTFEIVDQPDLEDPVAFSTGGGAGAGAGAGFGAGAGAGFSAGAGFGASAGAGFGVSADASFGASAGVTAGVSAGFGASASAGAGAFAGASASASAGAFAGASAGAFAGASASGSASAGAFAGASAGAFAGASASAGAGAFSGASAGAFAGASAEASAGAFAGASAGASAGAFASANASVRSGSLASAHVPAAFGAFARLRPPPTRTRTPIDIRRVLAGPASRRLTIDVADEFGPGGQVIRTGSSTTGAEVGQSVSFRERIEFED